jgi:transposase InsO family protein
LPRGWPRRLRSAVIHAIGLARLVLIAARGQATSGSLGRVCIDRLQQEILLLREEMRLKDTRIARVPAQCRPHYLPTERLAILELRAARGWSQIQTADRMLVTPATIASWMFRLDEEGPEALVQMRRPVNRFPDFVGYLVRRLKTLCPAMGKVRIAQVLARAGLHLGTTTVARMLETAEAPRPVAAAADAGRDLHSNRPNHIWHIDLTTVPTACGFWVPWLPWALPQRWPFCWWVAVVVDHFSRRITGFAVFTQNPTSLAVRQLLDRIIRVVGESPAHLITDHGTQFTDDGFRRWCQRRGIRQHFGAVGKYGSIAVVERLIRTMKAEALRRILVPLDRRAFCHEVGLFVEWYNGYRPHSALLAATPDEIYFQRFPAAQAPRFEPRRRWPHGSPCAAPHAPVRGRRGQRLELRVTYMAGRSHLPIVELKKAA